MRHLLTALRHRRRRAQTGALFLRSIHREPLPAPPHPSPPEPPKKLRSFTIHGVTWEDPYDWMSSLSDKVAMQHMEAHLDLEHKYTDAVFAGTEKLQSKLQSEMASRMSVQFSTPPIRWGPWLYYRRVEEGKQYPSLCRRLASLHEEFIAHKSPSLGFDFATGKRIEQKLIDYNQEAERFGGYAYEELSEVSPDHQFLAYTMYDKDNDYFRLCVRSLSSGALCSKPQADRVSGLAWAKDGQALLYVVTDQNKRPCRIYCSIIGSTEKDTLLLDESAGNVHVSIRNTKDFQFVTVNTFSPTFSKVFLINAADPLSGMTLAWECEAQRHCIVEHHQGYLYLFTDASKDGQLVDYHYLLRSPVDANPMKWESVLIDDPNVIVEDVDFSHKHLVLIIREGRHFKLCSVSLPLPDVKGAVHLRDLQPQFLPLPKHASQIFPGPNYDFYSSTMRFTISSPVMPDAVVDYDLSNGTWTIIQQQNMFHERTRVLYGRSSLGISDEPTTHEVKCEDDHLWNDLSEFYACEQYNVLSEDGVAVPLTIVYSPHNKKEDQNPGLLHGYGAYGDLLDKRWRSELKSLLDRGWVISFADVRGGGGGGKKWHHDGRRTKKCNSINDYISCAKFLIEKGLVHEKKLAAWGYSAGGLLVASAINSSPNLFRAAVLKNPFLDATNTLHHPAIPLTSADYEEFGFPRDINDFQAIQEYSPYDNIQKDVPYPAILITSSFNTRYGMWEAAKWAARVREYSISDPKRPVLLNFPREIGEENMYLYIKESAIETTFLLKALEW